MLSTHLLLPALLALFSPSPSNAYPYPHLLTRNLVDAPRAEGYDFVVCGGGAGGMAVASRLSDDPNVSVLLIEAGISGDEVREQIDYPQSAYYQSFVGTEQDWQYHTSAQGNVGDQELKWPRGKILGGSTTINGLYMTRPHQQELEAWKGLWTETDSSGAENWGWDAMSAAIRKTETFHPPTDEVASAETITWVDSYHGTDGPLHYGYPSIVHETLSTWVETMAAVGVSHRDDPAGGNSEGAYISTIAENPTNTTRSYARSGYLDPLPPRNNFDVIAGQYVTKIVFDSSSPPVATAVEYAASADASPSSVKVNKEVILAGGVIGTPQMLMVSGVGPKDIVEAAGVTSVFDLAGVGHHLQDHIKAAVTFAASIDTPGNVNASQAPESQTTEFRSYVSSGLAYVNLTTVLGADGANDFVTSAGNARDAAAETVPSGSSEVVDGYKAIYDTSLALMRSDVPQLEMLVNDMFPGVIHVQAALQHPFSHGRVYITSSSVFDNPVIDPQYLTHENDRRLLREGMKLARRIGQTEPLSTLIAEETSPGPDVSSDEDWDAYISQAGQTEYHPCGSCAMLPQSQGGVVDTKLKVYGLGNVRVVDSSVIPFSLATHTMTPTYALAEQAASIISAEYGSSSSSSSGNSDSSNSPSSDGDTDASVRISAHSLLTLSLIVFVHALHGLL